MIAKLDKIGQTYPEGGQIVQDFSLDFNSPVYWQHQDAFLRYTAIRCCG